ncbi:MAG TPA: energy transducer TonB [Longimicrobium sp.]|nr:energy transducer TonB [Longimicrobium sp.]
MTGSIAKTAAALAAALLTSGCERGPVPETPPRQLSESPFQYPEELWDAQVEGQTTLRLFISDSGSVDTVRVERTSGYAAFDSAALSGSRALRFQPATRGGKVVAAWFLLPVKFELNPADSASAAPTTAPATAGDTTKQ